MLLNQIVRGGKLVVSEAPWLWDGVLLKGSTNLVVALPKVGKTRLMCQVIGAMTAGKESFLGQRITADSGPVLIVGSDQNQSDWFRCLHPAGLAAADGSINDNIVQLFHKGCPLHLDEAGIDQIAELASQFPELIILLDSYYACTSHLGLDENNASIADPLLDLQEAIAPYGSTLIVIHHSNRSKAGGRASQASRGSTALPAAVSQTVTLSWASAEESNPLAPRDKRVKLTTEGREGQPIELLIEQVDDGQCWQLHGTGEQIAKTELVKKLVSALTDHQDAALRELCCHWNATGCGMDAVHLAVALQIDRATPRSNATQVLNSLERRHLVIHDGYRAAEGGMGGKPAKLFRPAEEVLPLFPEQPLKPVEPLIESVAEEATKPKRGMSGKRGSSESGCKVTCEHCGITFHSPPRGRKAKFCSPKCRTASHRAKKR